MRHRPMRGPGILAAACARAGVPLIHISTDYVFDGEKPGPYVEGQDRADQRLWSKQGRRRTGRARRRAAACDHPHLLDLWRVRPEFPQDDDPARGEKRRAARRRDQRGCPTSTPDLADAILAIAPQLLGAKGISGTYSFRRSGATTWHGFASRIVAAGAADLSRAAVSGATPITTAEVHRQRPRAARAARISKLALAVPPRSQIDADISAFRATQPAPGAAGANENTSFTFASRFRSAKKLSAAATGLHMFPDPMELYTSSFRIDTEAWGSLYE